jgi:hypothetical protein
VALKLARTLFTLTLLALVLTPAAGRADPVALGGRVAFVGGELKPDELIAFTAAVEAAGSPGVVLLDAPKATRYTRAFLEAYRPGRVLPVGAFPGGVEELEGRLKVQAGPALAWHHGQPQDLWRLLFPRAVHVVVCPAEPRPLLLQSACLAGTLHAPLFVLHGGDDEARALRDWLRHWHTRTVLAAGDAARACTGLPGVATVPLADENQVAAARLRHLLHQGPVTALVVANPADTGEDFGNMSLLAPWIALQRHAPLLFTGPRGDDVESVVRAALREPRLKRADALILVANLKAIPVEQRPNPIPADKDPTIDMEPFTPSDPAEPFTFATGRLFHEDPRVVTLMLARERLLQERPAPRRALVVSNAGGGLPLLETFSRNTAKELQNAGYDTTARFGKEITCDDLRRLLPQHDLFLWEGHHNTLIRDWAFPDWDEPLPPSFVFLQSCLALAEWKAQPVLQRGAVGVVGSSTRIYSGSGGACSLAFFDALVYDHQSLGGSLRQAKNFLVAYAQLKEKRLGKDAKRTGANLRCAWAFTLWGDPTFRLAVPPPRDGALPTVGHEVRGNTVVLKLPAEAHDKVSTEKYQVQMAANGRLAGLCRNVDDDDGKPLVPFVFAEVALPKAGDRVPRLHSRLPSKDWVFLWDKRRRTGYLLVTPRPQDEGELRFHIDWVGSNLAEER